MSSKFLKDFKHIHTKEKVPGKEEGDGEGSRREQALLVFEHMPAFIVDAIIAVAFYTRLKGRRKPALSSEPG